MSEFERSNAYHALYRELDILRTTTDKPIYEANELDLLIKVAGLTEAVVQEVVTLTSAKKLLRDHIEWLKVPPEPAVAPEPPSVEGSIKF